MSDLSGHSNLSDVNTRATHHNGGAANYYATDIHDAVLHAHQSGLPTRWDNGAPALPTTTTALALTLKRLLDIVGAIAGLLLLAPLMLLVTLIIKLTDPGPALFYQTRVGWNGTSFSLLKFRSMYVARCDPSGVSQTVRQDARVTPIGCFIRKTSIDELPQLFNVLLGQMSLVGPRPHVAGMMTAGQLYETLTPHYRFRHQMRPGITGWAQCHGLRGSTLDQTAALARLGHDIAYIQNFSLLLDLRILILTIRHELFSKIAN